MPETFYNDIRKRSYRIQAVKIDERNAMIAVNDALRIDWIHTNLNPIVDKLIDAISKKSQEGAFNVSVKVDSKTFRDMSVDPLFRAGPCDWPILTLVWGFIDMISNQDKVKTRRLRLRREIHCLNRLSWDKRNVLDDFVIRPNDKENGCVIFDISWY